MGDLPVKIFCILFDLNSPFLNWSWNLLWRNDDTKTHSWGKNHYLRLIGIINPTFPSTHKLVHIFPNFKEVRRPTLFILRINTAYNRYRSGDEK